MCSRRVLFRMRISRSTLESLQRYQQMYSAALPSLSSKSSLARKWIVIRRKSGANTFSVQMSGFQRSQEGVSHSEAFTHDSVHIGWRQHAIFYQIPTFVENGVLNPIESESLDFFFQHHWFLTNFGLNSSRCLSHLEEMRSRIRWRPICADWVPICAQVCDHMSVLRSDYRPFRNGLCHRWDCITSGLGSLSWRSAKVKEDSIRVRVYNERYQLVERHCAASNHLWVRPGRRNDFH